jgi:hypothetical protein
VGATEIEENSSGISVSSLTHSWSWALLEKLPIVQILENFPAFYETRRFITPLTWALHRSLSWARSIQTLPSHPTSIRSILILSTHIRFHNPYNIWNPLKKRNAEPLFDSCSLWCVWCKWNVRRYLDAKGFRRWCTTLGITGFLDLCSLEYRAMDRFQNPRDPEPKSTYLWLHSVKLTCIISKKKMARVLEVINHVIWRETVVQYSLGLKRVLGVIFITRVIIYPRCKWNWYLPDFGISGITNTEFM